MADTKSILYQPIEIGNMVVKNRLARSATAECMATSEGAVSERLLQLYEALAEGGAGLIITGLAYVQPNGQSVTNQIGIDRDDLVSGLRRLTESVRKNGDDCKIAVQIAHGGRQGTSSFGDPVAPSAVYEPMMRNMPREMTLDEIEETIEAFSEGARRAMEAGFDAVQLHAAHGYLLSEFLSPYTNRRTDEYGGSFEKRIRIVLEIYRRIVKNLGGDFPVLIKMNVEDFVKGGLKIDESKKLAEKFSKVGFSAIETSGGMWESPKHYKEIRGFPPEARIGIRSRDQEAYFLPYAREIKEVIGVPLMLVGGIRSFDVAEKIVEDGDSDLISMCRPLIREPDLPNKWSSGTSATADCISCNRCVMSLSKGVSCHQNK